MTETVIRYECNACGATGLAYPESRYDERDCGWCHGHPEDEDPCDSLAEMRRAFERPKEEFVVITAVEWYDDGELVAQWHRSNRRTG